MRAGPLLLCHSPSSYGAVTPRAERLATSIRWNSKRDCMKSSWVRSQQYILVAHKTTIELLWPRCVPLQSSVSTTIRTFQTVSEGVFPATGLQAYRVLGSLEGIERAGVILPALLVPSSFAFIPWRGLLLLLAPMVAATRPTVVIDVCI